MLGIMRLAVLILAVVAWQPPMLGQEGEAPDLAHYGAWRINMEKTGEAMGRPFTRQGPEFTWFLQPERDGLRFTVFETYPKPQPDRSYFATLDGTEWPGPPRSRHERDGLVVEDRPLRRLSHGKRERCSDAENPLHRVA